LTRRVNCVTLTPPPENVNIYFTQGRKHFEYYLEVAGSSFPVRQISETRLLRDAFSVDWHPKLFVFNVRNIYTRETKSRMQHSSKIRIEALS
jgi:hypothetical protein